MPEIAEFMRFRAPDPGALEHDITETRARLASAVQAAQSLAIVDAAADLGSMLTTARMEVEAARLLAQHMHHAEAHAKDEPAGWFWNAYATALQYCGRRDQAEAFFERAMEIARAGGWRRLEALVLHHWGRSLAEQARFAEAELRISDALPIRVELNTPNQESSRRALAELSALRDAYGCP